jgi:hypothetical protein
MQSVLLFGALFFKEDLMEKLVERRNRKLKQAAERLNTLAPLVRGNRPTVTCRGERLYLTGKLQDRRVPLASFSDSEELQRTLHLLSHAKPLAPDVLLEERIRLWAEQNVFAEKRKASVYAARKLDFPEAALRQQATMEEAWALRARERLCAAARDWLDVYRILPVHAGITDFAKHNPEAENEDDPVPCADFDFLSGEYRCHLIRNFSSAYRAASIYPDQNYIVELRRYHTENIRRAWERVVDAEILPLMAMIREEKVYRAPWRDLIKQVKAIVVPWSIPKPWPAGRMEWSNTTNAPSARVCRFNTSEVRAVTA